MTVYTIPALTASMEFTDLAYVGRYVDKLVESYKDEDYSVVYEWDQDAPDDAPPVAVLVRVDREWVRRQVLVTVVRTKTGECKFALELEGVNGH